MTFSYIVFGVALYFTLNNFIYLFIVIGFLFAKLITQYICFGYAAAKLNEKKLIPFVLIFDVMFSALNPVVSIASRFKD
jgi:hypothetical protein